MGLASKLAASQPPRGGGYQGQAPSGYTGGPPQQQQQQYPPALQAGGQKPGAYPGQGQQYQAYPGADGQTGGRPPFQQRPAFGSPAPPGNPYSGTPSSQPPYQQSPQFQQQPPYNQQSYNQPPQNYGRPPPNPPQSYQQSTQPQQYQQPYSQAPQQSPYNSSYGYGGPPPSQYPPGQYPPSQHGPPGQYPSQGPPPSQYQSQQGPPGQYPGQQYGGGPPGGAPAGPQQTAAYKQVLMSVIQEKQLQNMYPPNSPIVDQIASRVSAQVDQLCAAWRVPREVGQDIVKLALFDIVLYIDDSGSMQFEENGERIKDLKLILSRVAYAAALFDDDGVQVRFMNSNEQGNGIRSEPEVENLVQRIQFKGLTPMGTNLKQKVLDPLVVGPARSGQLRKPVLVITITDGQPAGEPQGSVSEAIRYAVNEVQRNPRYGRGAVSFQFAQVGNDLKAREFLSKLDEEPGIGELIDCTSNFEVEQDEMSRANPPVDLTPELWLTKLLLGAIDSSYDTKDEKGASRPSQGQYGAPGPQYGGGYNQGPPQQNYGQPQAYGQQSGYGQAPQQNYGQPPPQSQYGGQPGNYPPQQAGNYGRPPPGPPQGQGGPGGYGAPPPPPRY